MFPPLNGSQPPEATGSCRNRGKKEEKKSCGRAAVHAAAAERQARRGNRGEADPFQAPASTEAKGATAARIEADMRPGRSASILSDNAICKDDANGIDRFKNPQGSPQEK